MSIISCNKDDFENVVLKSKKVALVDFNATWCGPCRMMESVLEEFSSENDNILVASVDVDDESILASEYNVSSIPCLVVIKDGKEVKRNIGYIGKDSLEELMGDL